MSLLNEKYHSYKEFLSERKTTDKRLEFIDNFIFMSPSPNIKHQEISSILQAGLFNTLESSKCKVFAAPTDVLFDDKKNDEKKIVIPDLFVACEPDNFTENEYLGPPDFIIEILSPSNKSHDMVTKLNLYINYGVKEYWIVDPIDERVLVYFLDDNNDIQFELYVLGDNVQSKLFKGFKVNVEETFS